MTLSYTPYSPNTTTLSYTPPLPNKPVFRPLLYAAALRPPVNSQSQNITCSVRSRPSTRYQHAVKLRLRSATNKPNPKPQFATKEINSVHQQPCVNLKPESTALSAQPPQVLNQTCHARHPQSANFKLSTA